MTRSFRAAFACALMLLATPAIAQLESVKLLANASASSGTVVVPGDGYQFAVTGTFGGATVALYVSQPDGTLAVASGCSFTVAGSCTVNIGQGSTVQAQVSGGAPSGLYATLRGLGGPASTGGGGGGGGGDASAANQGSQITLETAISNRIGDAIASPASNTLADRLKTINATLGTPFQAGGSIGNTSFGISGTLPAFASTPTFNLGTLNGAATLAAQNTLAALIGPGNTAANCAVDTTQTDQLAATKCLISKFVTLLNTIGTVGSAAPTVALNFGGTGPSGNARSVLVSTTGGLLPGQAAPTSTRTTLTASTIMTIDVARSTRLLATVQFDGSPNAAIYLCFNGQAATCSATVYDIKVASGAADASVYTAPFGMTGIIYAFTTGTGNVVNVSSWLAQ